jgi:glucose/arabinose dehydrogenase
MRPRITIIALALVVALATCAPALAQSPQQSAYGGVIAEVVTPSKPKPKQQAAAQQAPTAAAQPTQSALPFTGLQVTLVLLAGIALLGTGLVLRRTTKDRTDS